MPPRKWWSKRKWPTTSSDASSISTRTSASSHRGRTYLQSRNGISQRRREGAANGSSTSSGVVRPAALGHRGGRAPACASGTHGCALHRHVGSVPLGNLDASATATPRSCPNQPAIWDHDNGVGYEEDLLNEIVLAIDVKGRVGGHSRLGACYYVASKETLYFLLDLKSGGFNAIESVYLHAEPTTILLPSRSDEAVEHIFCPQSNQQNVRGQENSLLPPYKLEYRPNAEFESKEGERRLLDLQLPVMSDASINLVVPGHEEPHESFGHGLDAGLTGRKGRLLTISTLVDLESTLGMGCVAAILSYLQRRRSVMYLPGDGEANRCLKISKIELSTLKGHMLVTADTLSALQIVPLESHLSSQNQGRNNTGLKETSSVYGLFHYLARTPQGRALLRQYFLRPSLDLEVIHERHATISMLLQPENEGRTNDLVKSLNQVKNMRPAMLYLHKGMSGVSKHGGIKNGVWMNLRSFAFFVLAIRTSCTELTNAQQLSVISRIIHQFHVHEIATIGRLITDIVDFQQSQRDHRTVVKTGVDEELDQLKRTYDGLEDLLSETSRAVAATVPQQFAFELNVVFLPQIGFLICMPMDPGTHRAVWEGDSGGEAWERIFSSSQHTYYKDYRMQEMDERIGDLHAAICDKEIEIVHELAQRVLEYEEMLCSVSDLCGELDVLLALAQGARLYKLKRPRMTKDNVIEVHEGRHLLQEQVQTACIPNDTLLVGGAGSSITQDDIDSLFEAPPPGSMAPPPCPTVPTDGPSMLVLTGPNYSGKSIYLKQVALIVFLAHVGSFVPATRATIGLTDCILTRIATRESVARPQSAFAIDLQQVSTALRCATRQSLVLFDEFGKGTAAADGAGLLCGVLEHLLARPTHKRAKVLVATHYHELFQTFGQMSSGRNLESGELSAPFLPLRPGLSFAHMAVIINQYTQSASEQVTYLYKLQPGRSLASLGMVCAALNGIDAAILTRAEDLVLLEASGGDLVAACANAVTEEDAELDAAEAVARRFLAVELEDEDGVYNEANDPGNVRDLFDSLL